MFKEKITNFIESSRVQNFIIVLIVVNSITIGLETSPYMMEHYGKLLKTLDSIILGVFVLEILLKLYAHRLSFFKSSWNVFDFVIVAIALVPSSGVFSVLRAIRIFRALRLIKAIPKLRFIVEALVRSIPSIGWIFVLLFLVFYVFAVIGTKLFGASFPDWFGNLGATMYTLFQVMTLESWSMGISRPVMEKYPMAFFYFIPFILLATYTTLNIFIAIVVNTMSEINHAEAEHEVEKLSEVIHDENEEVKEDIRLLREQISKLEEKLTKKKNIN